MAMPNLSKMQRIRKRELRRAMHRLRGMSQLLQGTKDGYAVYGLRSAVALLEEMRKEIDREPAEGEDHV